MNDKPAEKLNNDSLNGQPESANSFDGLGAELEKNLSQAVKAEMDGMTEQEMVEIYENSNTLKGMVAKRKKELTEEMEEKRKKKMALAIKLGTLVCLLGVLLIFGSIAWFTMNREVGTGGMSVSTSAGIFELEVRGDNVENSGTFAKADSSYENGVDQNLVPTSYQTGGSNGKIVWRKTGSTADDGHYDEGLSPNSHGKLDFWVVPLTDGAIDIEFSFTIRGFIGTYIPPVNENEEPSLDKLFEVNDEMEVTLENELKDAADLVKKQSALQYIQGHILFFSDYDSTTGYYSGFL